MRLVRIHDKNTGRLAGQDLDVAASTLEQLRQLDVGSWKGASWTGEKIPTIKEVLLTIPEGKKIFIEVKCGPEIIPALKESLSASQLIENQIVVISFNQDVIAQVKLHMPEIKAYWLTGFHKDDQSNDWKPDLTEIINILKNTKADGRDCCAHKVVDAVFAQKLASRVWNFIFGLLMMLMRHGVLLRLVFVQSQQTGRDGCVNS